MATYTRTITISLEPENAGKVLAAQQLSGTGANIGAEMTATFTDLGGGSYLLTSSEFDHTAKAIKIYGSGQPSTVLALATLEDAPAATDIKTGIAAAAKSAADAASSANDAKVAAETAGVDAWAAAEAAESADDKADQVLARLGQAPRDTTVTGTFAICRPGGKTAAVGVEVWVTNQAGDAIAGPVTSDAAGLARFKIAPTRPGVLYYVQVKSDRYTFVDYPKAFIVTPEDGFTIISDRRPSRA